MDEIIVKLFNLLDQLVEERGVPKEEASTNKNILKSENSPFDAGKRGKIRATFTPNEKRRLVEAYKLFNKMFFEYEKKEKTVNDVGQKTLVTKIATTQKRAVSPQPKKETGLMSMILGGLALLGTAILTLVGGISGIFGDWGGVAKVVGKLGLFGALKMIGKTILKRFAKSVLKRLPIIGGIIGLGYAAAAFSKGNIFLGISELISGLLNFVPYVGPLLSLGADILIAWAEAKGMYNEGGALSPENGWATIKGWAKDIGKWIWDHGLYLPIIGTFKRFGMAQDAFSSGSIVEGLKQIIFGLVTFNGCGALVKGAEILSAWLDNPREGKDANGNIKAETGWDTILGWADDIGKWIWDHGLYLPIIGTFKRFGMAGDEFSSGNIVKGLGQIVAGIVTFNGCGALVKGAEILSAWLENSREVKNSDGTISSETGWTTIKGWAKDIGNWIWDHSLYMPILGTFKRFGMAGDAFSSGNYAEGIKQIGFGILTFGGSGALVKGIEFLLGWISNTTSEINTLTPNATWTKKLSVWIQSKLQDLPEYLKAPLRWFGIIDDDKKTVRANPHSDAAKAAQKKYRDAMKEEKEHANLIKKTDGSVVEHAKKVSGEKAKEIKKSVGGIWGIISGGISNLTDSIGKITKSGLGKGGKAMSFLGMIGGTLVDKTKEMFKGAGGFASGLADDFFGKSDEAEKPVGDGAPNMVKNSEGDKKSNEGFMGLFGGEKQKKSATMDTLYDSSEKQVKLLSNLVNLAVQSLTELKRMTGSGGGAAIIGGPTIQSEPATANSSMGVFGNRDAYLTSAYSLG